MRRSLDVEAIVFRKLLNDNKNRSSLGTNFVWLPQLAGIELIGI